MVAARMMAALRALDYKIFSRPYELNIVGVRSPATTPNQFDDEIHVFYQTDSGKLQYHIFPATTDPGTYWLRQPDQPQGTAILAEGQYLNVYAIDLHRGKYFALCQRKGNVTVIRDYDRDAVLDFNNGTRLSGYFGINIHRANAEGITKTVERHSAGCQVFANADDFAHFMQLCETHRKLYGNVFTYTLIDLRALIRAGLKRGVFAIAVSLMTFLVLFLSQEHKTVSNEKAKE